MSLNSPNTIIMVLDSNIKFSATFTISGFAEYMSLVFQDDEFTSEELLPIVYKGIETGLEKYSENSRNSDLFTYITYFVKSEILKFKNSTK
jgi:hypothetical protein